MGTTNLKINVLGTKWNIFERTNEQDKYLNKCDGYCDKTTKTIVITKQPPDSEIGNWEVYRRKILRHEIIHAFLIESGLCENWVHTKWGHDETFIDWFAIQFPKIKKAFEQANCED